MASWSRRCRAFGEFVHDDATRKLLPWNSSFTASQKIKISNRRLEKCEWILSCWSRDSSSTSTLGGYYGGRGLGRSPEQIVSHMYKYAVFDIKPTYNHNFYPKCSCIHLPKISVGGQRGCWTSDWGAWPACSLSSEPPLRWKVKTISIDR